MFTDLRQFEYAKVDNANFLSFHFILVIIHLLTLFAIYIFYLDFFMD